MGRTEYGSEFNFGANAAFYRPDAASPFANARYYRSGRDAMKALARLLRGRASRVLLPALCCESMLEPFSQNGYEIVFYKLNKDLRGDTEDVLKKMRGGTVPIYMRYFGIRPFEDSFLQELKRRFPDCVLAEDRTQDILAPREDGFTPDACFASLRKWAALPEGGVLQTAFGIPDAAPDRLFYQTRERCMHDKDSYLEHPKPELKADFMERFHCAERLLDAAPEAVGISPEGQDIIYRLDFGRIYKARCGNIAILRERLEPLCRAGRLRLLTDTPERSALYLPVLLDERDRVWRHMIDEKIYCAVIWPTPEGAGGVCPNSEHTAKHMLGLICDQRYGADDMHFIADTLEAALK